MQATDAGLEVLLQGQLHIVEVEDERQRKLPRAIRRPGGPQRRDQLRAPMPGLIVAVPVVEGQSVTKGQDLIILESMKMQNELKAPRDGTIGHVRVRNGDSVEQNQVLLTLD